ncbi:hypothetical protein BC936DRAFT_145075 [Jimgerdemannia flammicorona]|uniref:Uncharacterized protein n=1 Tax=Jimgerdemannia flammicorona TaxID=994334 RepID=A0A433DB05_9FUNG|nr:hypothetical protein BC936DRAFT_145075 [Jimgerdemannia flammicorona]
MARPKKLPGALKELITKLAATNSLKKKLPSTKDVQSALRNAIKAINETDSIPSEEVLAAFETIAEAFPRIPTIVSHDQGSAKRKGTSGGGPDLERALSMLHLEFVGHVIARVTALALVPEDDEGNEELEKDKEKGMVQVLTKAYQIVQVPRTRRQGVPKPHHSTVRHPRQGHIGGRASRASGFIRASVDRMFSRRTRL